MKYLEKLLKQFEKNEEDVRNMREYNTTNYINSYEIREENGQVDVIVTYEICYDEDRPCDFDFDVFQIDHVPTQEEKDFLKEHGYYL